MKERSRLEQMMKCYEAVLDLLDEGVHVIDTSGKTLLYNKKMSELEGFTIEEVLYKDIREVLPSLTAETSTLLKAIQTGRPVGEQKQTYFTVKGKEITTVNRTFPIYLENELIGALELAQDISEVKRLTDQMMQNGKAYGLPSRGKSDSNNTRYTFDMIIGKSLAFQEAIEYAKRAARSHSTVLIYGETGTGKEMIAQSIHNASARAGSPFIAQNCSAIPESLLEGILFGTKKGSFTGAIDRPGIFEQAHGGTLLLDEIHTMDVAVQAKLLRVLQEGQIQRIGATQATDVDVRVIATINIDPIRAMKEGLLREDLYYRLGVVCIHIPPLRERKEDIPELVHAFLHSCNKRVGTEVREISDELLDVFMRYSWPGNVRQLEHVIEGALNMVQGERKLQMEHLSPYFRVQLEKEIKKNDDDSDVNEKDGKVTFDSGPMSSREDERERISETLRATHGNISKAARLLGISRQLLQYKLKKYGIPR
jgi:arginine utilization regulatory protein